MKLENYPIVKVLLPYLVGIMIAYFGDFSDKVCDKISYVTAMLFVVTILCSFVKAYKWRAVTTTVMTASFLFVGILITNKELHPPLPDHSMEENADWVVRVSEEPTPREKSVKVVAELLQTPENQKLISKILLYLQPSDEAQELRYGDLLFVHTNLSRIEPPHNPDAFDNQQYMRRRGIYYSGFVHDGAWQCLDMHPPID